MPTKKKARAYDFDKLSRESKEVARSQNSFANYDELNQFLDDALQSIESDRETHGVRSMGIIIRSLDRLPRKQAILAAAHLVQVLEDNLKSNDFIRLLEEEVWQDRRF